MKKSSTGLAEVEVGERTGRIAGIEFEESDAGIIYRYASQQLPADRIAVQIVVIERVDEFLNIDRRFEKKPRARNILIRPAVLHHIFIAVVIVEVIVAKIQPLDLGTGFGADDTAAAIFAADFSAGVKKSGDILAALIVDRVAAFVGTPMAQFDKDFGTLVYIGEQLGAKTEIVEIFAVELKPAL